MPSRARKRRVFIYPLTCWLIKSVQPKIRREYEARCLKSPGWPASSCSEACGGRPQLAHVRPRARCYWRVSTLYIVLILSMRASLFSPCSLNTVAKRLSSTMPQTYVKRVTLFKVPKSEDVDQARYGTTQKMIACMADGIAGTSGI